MQKTIEKINGKKQWNLWNNNLEIIRSMQEVTGKMQYDIKTAFFQTSRFSYSGRIASFSPQFPNSIFFFNFYPKTYWSTQLCVLIKQFTVTTSFPTFYDLWFHYKAKLVIFSHVFPLYEGILYRIRNTSHKWGGMFDLGFWELTLLLMAFKTSYNATLGWVIGVQDDSSWDQAIGL